MLTLTLSNIPSGCDYRVALCDVTGNVIMDDTASGTNRKIEGFSILKNEDYYIIVYSSAGSSNTQAYTLVSSYAAVADKEPDGKEVIDSPQNASAQTAAFSSIAAQAQIQTANAVMLGEGMTTLAARVRGHSVNSSTTVTGRYRPQAV